MAKDANEIKELASGLWVEILRNVAGISDELLDGRGHPCPKCGGDDRFWAYKDVADNGGVGCRKCPHKGGDGFETVKWMLGCDFKEASTRVGEYLGVELKKEKRTPVTPWKDVANYEYLDERGKLLFQVLRQEATDQFGDKLKKFPQRHRGPNGEWVWNTDDCRKVLYRLPELIASNGLVFLCEGEKDVENLRRLGMTGTCNPCGATRWLDEYSQFLEGRDCVLLEDNDSVARIRSAPRTKPHRPIRRISLPPDCRFIRRRTEGPKSNR